MSPGWAPDRTTGGRPPRSPSAVTATVSVGLDDMSPPTTPAPTSAASSDSPVASPSAQPTSRSAGAQNATRKAAGSAPRRGPHGAVVAGAEQGLRPGAEARDDPGDQTELADLGNAHQYGHPFVT